MHAEFVKLVLKGSENSLVDFIGPICDHLRNSIVSKRVANEMKYLLINAAHQVLLAV